MKFVLVGVVATITTFIVLIVGVEAMAVNAVLASVIGYAAGIAVNYQLNYRYTFGSDQHHRIVLPKFLVVMLIGMLVNAAVMYTGINLLEIHYLLVQFLAVLTVFMLSFTANRLWTFAT